MSPPRLVAMAVLFAGATALAAAAALGASGSHPRAKTKPYLTLSGHVAGLYPGGRRKLVVVVRNHARRSVRLRSVTARVGAANRRCGGQNLQVGGFRGARRIKARGAIRLTLEVVMRRTSPPACQGGVFPLGFRGRATAG